jgi:hypothetical protein
MATLEDLHQELREIHHQEEVLHRRRSLVVRAFVRAAGGLTEAAELLAMDPRTVVQLQRLGELAMVVYRGAGTATDADGRVYGETGQGDASQDQLLADGRWWRVAKASRKRIRLLIVVASGRVCRIWEVEPNREWDPDPGGGGKVALPLGPRPLAPQEVADRYPDLGVAVGDERRMRQGLLREYIPLDVAASGSNEGELDRDATE